MKIEDGGTTVCRSCGRETSNRGRWSPVIVRGETTGYTCPACPKHGEPIRRLFNGAGVRFRVTLDAGITATGKRKQESKLFPTLGAAREYAATRSVELRKARGEGRPVLDREHMTLDVLCDRWLESKRGRVREVTRETYSHSLKPVRRRLGARKVQSITYDDVERLATWLTREGGRRGQGLGVHAARTSLTTLKQVLDRAIRVERIVSENVARGVTPPKTHDPEAGVLERWTATELVKFTRHADTDVHAAAWRLVSLGLRREEVLGLTWDAVDFDAGTVTVRQSRVKVSRKTDPEGWIIGPPKSKASRRMIRPDDVQPGTMAALRRLLMASGRPAHGLVVFDEAGQPIQPDRFSDRFTALCGEAEVPAIHVHSTRHTVAYLLHDAGVPPVRAAAHLGHTLNVHLSVYLFAREEDVETAGLALGQVLTKAAAGS